MSITDHRHASVIRGKGHRLWDDLLDLWHAEHHDASAPRSGPAVTVSGGEVSDPTMQIATDDTRERHAVWIGSRITGLLDALEHEVSKLQPKSADELPQCSNCDAAVASDSSGRCDICGPYWRNSGSEYDREQARDRHLHRDEFRACGACGEDIRISEGKRTCDACRSKKYRDNKRESDAA
jgi:hypothetical protein